MKNLDEDYGEKYNESVGLSIMEDISKDVKDHGEKIARIETKIESMGEKIEKLDSISEAITRLTTLMETNKEESVLEKKKNDRRDELMRSFSFTLEKVNLNLDKLNSETKETQENLSKLEIKMDEKIQNIEHEISSNEEIFKFDVRVLIKKYGIQFVAMVYIIYQAIEKLF